MFSVRRVQKRDALAPEQLGSKYKFWFRDGERRMLFKAEERGTGEDWAEKVSDCLPEMLGLPHVSYELAELCDGERVIQPGVVCETCAPPPRTLVLGNQLLLVFDQSYPTEENRKYRVREHTVQAVSEVVRVLKRPPHPWSEGLTADLAALDIFVGYVMFDAWIANQDRHHENWGALWVDPVMHLAPTFDHGAALARNLTDQERHERLHTRDRNRTIESFARKARSAFYYAASDPHPLGTLDALREFEKHASDAVRYWSDRLAKIDAANVKAVLDEVPQSRMSNIGKAFTLQLLRVNQERLLEGRNG